MKIKICGLMTQEAIDTAIESGADYLGFVFAESRRRITPKQTALLTKKIPAQVKKVGVFVSPTIEELQRTVAEAGLDLVQIHGELPLLHNFSVPVIRAASVVNGKLPENLATEQYDYLLLDAPPKEYVGGNGEVFDWQQVSLADLANQQVFIAGGLNAENVLTARAYFQPYAVDVSSGVETNGKKDGQKIREFIATAKSEAV